LSTFVVADHVGILIHGRCHVTSLGQRAHTRWATVVCSDDHLPTDAGDCESISGWVANGSDSENTEDVEKFRDNAFGV